MHAIVYSILGFIQTIATTAAVLVLLVGLGLYFF